MFRNILNGREVMPIEEIMGLFRQLKIKQRRQQ